MKRFQGPDGVVLEFPPDIDDAAILEVFKKQFGAPNAYEQPAPPPGVVIHGADKSYISDQPDVSVTRSASGIADPEAERRNAVEMDALKWRGDTGGMGAIGRGLMPLAQGLGFGATDEVVSGAQALTAPLTGQGMGDAYDVSQERQRQELLRERTDNPIRSAAGEIAGGVAATVPLAMSGATASRFVPDTAAGIRGLLMRSAAGAADGAVVGSAYGAASADQGSRMSGALTGGALGTVGGALAPAVASTARSAGNALGLTSVASRARDRLAGLLQRSGMTPQQIQRVLGDAAADGQDMFTVGDAMGRTGREEFARLSRTASDTGDDVFRTLEARQLDAQRRLGGFVDEAATGRQGYTSNMARNDIIGARDAAANTEYGAARAAAGAVDPTDAIAVADNFLGPNAPAVPQSPLPDDSIEALVRRARGMLTDGNSSLTDWNAAHRTKMELDAMIERAPNAARRLLIPMRDRLDDALSAASQPYATARNNYRTASRSAEAVDTGREMAMRGRFEDNLATYGGMAPEQQTGARVGYGSRVVEDVRSGVPTGDPTSRLRGTDTRNEIDALLGPRLNRQVDREYDMFRSWNRVAGGSPTAQNLAEDAAGGSGLAGTIMDTAGMNVGGLVRRGLEGGLNMLRGESEPVRALIARALLTNDTAGLVQALQARGASRATIDAVTRMLLTGGAQQALPAPQR